MNTMTISALTAMTLAGLAHAQDFQLEGPYAPSRWSDTGISEGTTQVRKTVEMFYDVLDSDPADGVSFRTAEYSTIANNNGVLNLYYDARFRHLTFNRNFLLQAFVDGPGGRVVFDLVDIFDPQAPDSVDNFEGTVTLNTIAGFRYGFIFGGAHFNFDGRLNGNLVLIEQAGSTTPLQRDSSLWSAGPMLEGVTGVRPALQFDYGVSLGGGGVDPRSTDLLNFATENGEAAFNYTYTGDHAFFLANASLSAFTNTDGGEQVQPIFSGSTNGAFSIRGRTSVPLDSSNAFGIRVGGDNFDQLSYIRGTVVLSRFTATTAEVCAADLDGNGLVNFFDVAAYINQFKAGCP